MTFDEVRNALSDAVQTGKLGTPVAARVHLLVDDNEVDVAGAAEKLLTMLTPCFDQPPATIRARRHDSGRVQSLLMQTRNGQTIFITIGRSDRSSLHLLVVGNHGIVRLEGGAYFAATQFEGSHSELAARITESCETGRVVSLV